MNRKLILATLATFVAYFLGGWVIFGMLMKNFYNSHCADAAKALMIDPPNMPLLIIGNLCYAVLIAWVMQGKGATTIMKAIMASVILNVLMGLGMDFMFASMMNMYTDATTVIMVDVLANAGMGILTGIAGGAVLAAGNKD